MKNLSYLKDCPIAVLGGGAVGKTVAADCKLAGREVRLYSRSSRSLANVERSGIRLDGIQRNLYDFHREGTAIAGVFIGAMCQKPLKNKNISRGHC